MFGINADCRDAGQGIRARSGAFPGCSSPYSVLTANDHSSRASVAVSLYVSQCNLSKAKREAKIRKRFWQFLRL